MTRDDRFMAIVLMLRARKRVTARQLAQILGVTERTIYRDMQALQESDVPIASTPGIEGGYELREGYYVPPIMLNKDEAVALFLGGTFIADRKGTPFQDSIRTALQKLEPLLPETAREPAIITKDHVRWDVQDADPTEKQAGHLSLLTKAIQQQKCVHMAYASDEKNTERTISPYGMVYTDGKWYLVGYCHLRAAIRMFRVDRITSAELTDEDFDLPADFDLDRYTGKQWAESLERRLRNVAPSVTVRIPPALLDEVDKHWLHRFARRESIPDSNDLLVTLHDDDPQNTVRLVRSWGPSVEVIAPEEIRQQLLRESECLAATYGSNADAVR